MLEAMNMVRRLSRAGLVLGVMAPLGLLAVAGCSDPTAPRFEIEVAAGKWAERGPASYVYIFRQSCECLLSGPYVVTVEDGTVKGAQLLPFTTPPAPTPDLALVPTIDDLFERLRSAADAGPVRFEVEFDSEYGYPTSGSYDLSAEIADDEYSFEARELGPVVPFSPETRAPGPP